MLLWFLIDLPAGCWCDSICHVAYCWSLSIRCDLTEILVFSDPYSGDVIGPQNGGQKVVWAQWEDNFLATLLGTESDPQNRGHGISKT